MSQQQRKFIQPFMVAGTSKYYQKIVMQHGISHIYGYTVDESDKSVAIAVPDGCVDILFNYGESEMTAKVYGTVLKHTEIPNEFAHTIFGVRFFPGILPPILEGAMKELVGQEIDLADLVEDRTLCGQISETRCFEKQADIFMKHYMNRLAVCREQKEDGRRRIARVVKEKIEQTSGQIRIQELEAQTGYSTRYIRKVFHEYLGLSPKTFCKIVQFQKVIDEMNHNSCKKMLDVSADMGYYDQSQFINDFKTYTDMTPKDYCRMIGGMEYYERFIMK